LKPGAGKLTLLRILRVRADCPMFDYFVYLLYRVGFALITILPLRTLFALGNALGFCAWVLLRRYRRLALQNIEIAFGDEKSLRELHLLVRQHFQRLGANLLCSIKLGAVSLERLTDCIEIENLDAIHQQLRAGRPVVLVLSHIGNWESISQILPKFIGYVRNSTIYQKFGNRFIDEHVRSLRGRAGVETFDRSEGFQKPVQLLRGGGAIGILSDQHAGDQGLWVPFFGRLASTTPLPALLAKRTDAALIAMACYTNGPTRWRVVVEPALDPRGESVESLTAQANDIIAQQIRRAPEDWFWVHNRWKTPRPNFLLARYKRGVYLPSEIARENLKPFRILIRASNWLGDSIMSIPAIRAIKAGRPDAHVTVLTPGKLAPIWKLIPEVDDIICLTTKSLFATVRLIRQKSRFDVAIVFPNSLRAALEVWVSAVPRRVGYRGHCRSLLLNQILRERRTPGPPQHQSERYLRIARDCGAAPMGNVDLVGRERRTRHAGKSRANALAGSASTPYQLKLGLCPGAEYGQAKRWLAERFAEVGSTISTQTGARWVLFGTKNDAAIGETIAAVLDDNCTNRIGQTTLEQLIDELRACRLLLTNDTGTMHLAALLGVPVVAIFGSTEPRLTAPPGDGHMILRHHVECSPCFLRECPIDFRCMKAVSVREVCDAIMLILEPAAPETRR
jgi:heptosyltransferase-2